jgi:hypothetical protein
MEMPIHEINKLKRKYYNRHNSRRYKLHKAADQLVREAHKREELRKRMIDEGIPVNF